MLTSFASYGEAACAILAIVNGGLAEEQVIKRCCPDRSLPRSTASGDLEQHVRSMVGTFAGRQSVEATPG